MLQITELLRAADQGRTTPFLCNASDDNTYFVKGYAATVAGLMKEWLGAHLARTFGLPVPDFEIAYLDHELVNSFGGKAVTELKGGYVFASKQIQSVTELKFETVKVIDSQLKLKLLIFDLWLENEDRTLTEKGGNPNLLWKTDCQGLYIIDHNMIFDDTFNKSAFWSTHVFRSILDHNQYDLFERAAFESLMQNSITCWKSAWDKMPSEWVEFNDETLCFNPDKHLQRLRNEANGEVWLKLP